MANKPKYPDNWLPEIAEMEAFFATAKLPLGFIKISECEIISDTVKFIDTHISSIKAQNGNPTFLPYLERLRKLKTILSNG